MQPQALEGGRNKIIKTKKKQDELQKVWTDKNC